MLEYAIVTIVLIYIFIYIIYIYVIYMLIRSCLRIFPLVMPESLNY